LNNDLQYRDFLTQRLKNLSEAIEKTHKLLKNVKNYEGIHFQDPDNFGVLIEYFDNIALNKQKMSLNESFYIFDNFSLPINFFTLVKQKHGSRPFGIKITTYFKPEKTDKYWFQAVFSDGGSIFPFYLI
jgi:hypothetical protein